MSMQNNQNCSKGHAIWAVVPAAGIGRRMQSSLPKQYLKLNEQVILAHTINRLLSFDCISGLVISLQPDDTEWQKLSFNHTKPVIRAAGGSERCDSVLNALQVLAQQEGFNCEQDWVMVHDAVRPCVCESDISHLVAQVKTEHGGLLALPVRDTMKRQHADLASVSATVEREGLWHALTPQYFPWKILYAALHDALKNNLSITDESSAMEFAGYSPLLVTGREDNIKITRPADLELAKLYLSRQLADC